LRMVRDPRSGRARHALREAAPARRLAPVGDRRRRRDRAGRARRLGLHRLPARDRQARESDHPPPRTARPRAADGMRTERVADGVSASIAEPGDLAVGNAGFVDLGGETLIFDTHVSLAAARRVRKAAEEHGPARAVVLSHWHGDHVYGAGAFDGTVVATRGTADLMRERTEARLAELKRTPPEEVVDTPFAELARTELPSL